MTFDEAIRIASLRERLYRCIEDALREDSHHKSYEGALDVTLSFPNIFSRNDPPMWTIEWHCYVVPDDGRHISWSGRTLAEALAVAEDAADKLAAPFEMRRFVRSMDDCCDDPEEADGSAIVFGPSRSEESRSHQAEG